MSDKEGGKTVYSLPFTGCSRKGRGIGVMSMLAVC